MGRAHELHVILDCRDPDALAPFWARALGYGVLWTSDPYVALGSDGAPVTFLLQRVPEARSGKNRMHVDIPVDDIEAKAAELEAAGATRLDDEPRRHGPARWLRMSDPEGNEFCLAAR